MTDIERAQEAVRAAVAAGASAADAVLIEEDDTAVHVRDGRTEQVQNSLSRGIGVRAFQGARAGIAYTNDTTPASIRDAAQQAVALASVAAPDESAGLPDREEQGAIVDDLALVDEDRASWTAETWLDLARRAEEAATADERIAISEGSG